MIKLTRSRENSIGPEEVGSSLMLISLGGINQSVLGPCSGIVSLPSLPTTLADGHPVAKTVTTFLDTVYPRLMQQTVFLPGL